MKVQIRDKEAMDSLTIASLRAYLEAQGWGNNRPWGTWATILSKEGGGKMWEVSVPNEAGGLLYAESVAEIIATLAEAEDRSQLDVFYDLANAVVVTARQDDQNGTEFVPDVWCVRAEKGKYTGQFVDGGYVAAGWLPKHDLASVKDKEEIRNLFEQEHTEVGDNRSSGWHIGQVDAFSLKINVGDYVITPEKDSSRLWYGRIASKPHHKENPNDGCPWPNRRKVDWAGQPLNRNELSGSFQRSLMRTLQAVFKVRHREEFLTVIGPHRKMLGELLKMGDNEFEMFVGTALKHKNWKIAK